MPLVRPLTVTGEVVPAAASDQFDPPSVEYWYLLIAAPPSAPAVNVIDAEAFPGVAFSAVGAAGATTEGAAVSTLTAAAPLLAT